MKLRLLSKADINILYEEHPELDSPCMVNVEKNVINVDEDTETILITFVLDSHKYLCFTNPDPNYEDIWYEFYKY